MKSIIVIINRWFILSYLNWIVSKSLGESSELHVPSTIAFHWGPGRQPLFLKNAPEFDGRKTDHFCIPVCSNLSIMRVASKTEWVMFFLLKFEGT